MASQQAIKDNYANFEVPYYGTDNDDYVNGEGFCCDNKVLKAGAIGNGNDNPELFQYYYHSDHLGSSSLITNLDGEVVQHVEYVPFGEVFIEERNNTWNTPYLFNAKELDEETGNYYFGKRYYDPRVSIWLSPDLLQEKYPNISTYAYCALNPVKFIDPTGMDWYQHAESGGTFWQEGNAGHVDRDGLRYNNIGAAYVDRTNSNMSVSFMQDQVLSVNFLDESTSGGDRFNSQLSQGTMSTMEKWSNSNNFFASLSYNILNDAYVTLQPLTFELITGGGRTNEFTGGHAHVNLDGTTNYKGVDSATRTMALIFGSFGSGSAATKGGGKLYEIGDGVRRAKAAEQLGRKTIEATDHTGKIFEVSIKNLRSPFKNSLDLTKPIEQFRYDRIYNGYKAGDKIPPIYVNQGSRGIRVSDINLIK